MSTAFCQGSHLAMLVLRPLFPPIILPRRHGRLFNATASTLLTFQSKTPKLYTSSPLLVPYPVTPQSNPCNLPTRIHSIGRPSRGDNEAEIFIIAILVKSSQISFIAWKIRKIGE